MSTGTPRGIEGARRTNERAVRVRAHRKEEETIEPSRRDGPAGARGAWREGPGRPVLAWGPEDDWWRHRSRARWAGDRGDDRRGVGVHAVKLPRREGRI